MQTLVRRARAIFAPSRAALRLGSAHLVCVRAGRALLVGALAVVTLAVATLPGCASTSGDGPEDGADPAVVRLPDVSTWQLARELGLRVVPDTGARVVLEAPGGARILVFPGTRIASVAGRTLELEQPATTSGADTWLVSADAAAIRATWNVQVAMGATVPLPSADPAYRVPLPDQPSARAGARAPTGPAPTAAPAGFGDNRPTAAEIGAWSVPIRRKWQYIVVHHSASAAGDAAAIDRWHKDRGMDGLGYDFVIGNGTGTGDGAIEVGYRWRQQLVGAHAKTAGNFMNEHGIGICLVGDFMQTRPTPAQLRSLDRLCTFLAQYCGIPPDHLRMHGDVKSTDCPGRYFPHDFAIRLPSGALRTAASGSGRGTND